MGMSGRFLLDTNIVIAFFAEDEAVMERLADASEVFVPSIVLGELYYGAYKSVRVEENEARIDSLVVASSVLMCDAETAGIYGQIKNRLRKKGHPIPENDLWIAAIATQNNLTLVTRDSHFDEVGGLPLEAW